MSLAGDVNSELIKARVENGRHHHVRMKSESGDHGQTLEMVILKEWTQEREPHGRLKNKAQRGHERK